jgi:hypothetical protein
LRTEPVSVGLASIVFQSKAEAPMMAGVLFSVAAKMATVPQIEITAIARSLRVILIIFLVWFGCVCLAKPKLPG